VLDVATVLPRRSHARIATAATGTIRTTLMTDRRSRTLLRPNAPEWGALNEQKRSLLTPPADTPIEDLLRSGQRVSEQAALLRRAIEKSDGRNPSRS
jgi:hypothetical protein